MLQPGTPPVAVLDTSVLVPAWSRVTLQILASGATPRYQPVWSEWIIAETWRVLTDRLARAGVARRDIAAQANSMLRHLLPVMRLVSVAVVPPAAQHPPIDDPNDALVWATAVIGKAGYVVSHNTAHFPPLVEEHWELAGRAYTARRHVHSDIEFLTAIEFIVDVLGERAVDIYLLPPGGAIRSRRSVIAAASG